MSKIGEGRRLYRRGSDAVPIMVPGFVADPALAEAIANDSIAIAFQPILSLPARRIVGVEALARWTGGQSATALFERAARGRLSQRLSRHMQVKALTAAAGWTGAMRRLDLSINILPEDLANAGFASWLLAAVERAAFDPGRLTVEITEHRALAEGGGLAGVTHQLAQLRSAGIRIALDDFGTGFASLASLAGLPLDLVKLDRSLVAGIERCERARIVVKTILDLAHRLDLATVVEGVETAAQLDLLTDWGCMLYQGYLGGRSMDSAALAQFVAA